MNRNARFISSPPKRFRCSRNEKRQGALDPAGAPRDRVSAAVRFFKSFFLSRPNILWCMSTPASFTFRTLGNSDLQLTPIGFGAWAIGGGNWEFAWGPQDDNESIAAIHRALDLGINWIDTAAIYGLGHSEEVVGRAVKTSTHKPLCLYQVLHALARGPLHLPLAQGRFAGRGAGGLAAAAGRGDHRPLPDSLAQPGGRNRRGLGGAGAVPGAGQGSLDRRLQLLRRADEAGAEDCADHQPAAALLDAAPGDRGGDSALRAGQRHRRHQLFADGLGPADGRDDGGARGGFSGRRLAAARGRVQRAAPEPEPAPGGVAARDRQRPWGEPGRGGRGLDAAPSGDHGGNCGRAQRKAGGRAGAAR